MFEILSQFIMLNIMLYIVQSEISFIVEPGALVVPTKGGVWPKPENQIVQDEYFIIQPSIFRFQIIGHDCDILESAKARYEQIIRKFVSLKMRGYRTVDNNTVDNKHSPRRLNSWREDPLFHEYLESIQINLKKPCEIEPYLDMDESYEFRLNSIVSSLESVSVWGILRGLETFSQLLYLSDDKRSLTINFTEIQDRPRFRHRGLLIDTARHYLTLFTIFKILDGMSYNKLNVLHWHIVDDQSFPYQSISFPELSDKGAFEPNILIYTPEDVQKIIEYARIRGIRIIVEFDTPGHTRSWGVSHPELLTECFGQINGQLGPINPTKNITYEFIEKLFSEVTKVFPDKFLHLGGDEVAFNCWKSNADILQYMNTTNISDVNQLQGIYIKRLVHIVTGFNASSIVWQEIYESSNDLPSTTIIHVWKSWDDPRNVMYRVTNDGFSLIISSNWYLDHISSGGDWYKYYEVDPHDFGGNENQNKLVLGGEACMWGEVVDNTNILQRIFPRVSAVAERLWSQKSVTNRDDAERRLEEHTCRMRLRGLPAQPPNGPSFCV